MSNMTVLTSFTRKTIQLKTVGASVIASYAGTELGPAQPKLFCNLDHNVCVVFPLQMEDTENKQISIFKDENNNSKRMHVSKQKQNNAYNQKEDKASLINNELFFESF